MVAAVASFHLGEVERALDDMRVVIAEQPTLTWPDCLPQANLLAMYAWSGTHGTARSMFPALSGRLARAGQANRARRLGYGRCAVVVVCGAASPGAFSHV